MIEGFTEDEDGLKQPCYDHDIKNGKVIDIMGNLRWYKDNEYHREDGPALEFKNGSKWWYLNGDLVYSEYSDYTGKYELNETMKKQIIKHKLERM